MKTTIANEMMKKEERANNVILAVPEASLGEPDRDYDFVSKLSSDIGIPETRVNKVRRIKRRINASNTVPNYDKADSVLVVVELESVAAKTEI